MLSAKISKELTFFSLETEIQLGQGILALVGPSGSGKTTILHCLAGLETPDQGEIILNGKVFFSSEQKIDIPSRARNIGYVFQDLALFPHLTVKKNVLYGIPKGCKSKVSRFKFSIKEVLDLLKITHLQERYPYQLSGGEKQRVALARALMAEPDLLLLDEPFSALDDPTSRLLQKELKQLQRIWKIPFVLVTHDQEEAAYLGDQLLYLENGKGVQLVACSSSRETERGGSDDPRSLSC